MTLQSKYSYGEMGKETGVPLETDWPDHLECAMVNGKLSQTTWKIDTWVLCYPSAHAHTPTHRHRHKHTDKQTHPSHTRERERESSLARRVSTNGLICTSFSAEALVPALLSSCVNGRDNTDLTMTALSYVMTGMQLAHSSCSSPIVSFQC